MNPKIENYQVAGWWRSSSTVVVHQATWPCTGHLPDWSWQTKEEIINTNAMLFIEGLEWEAGFIEFDPLKSHDLTQWKRSITNAKGSKRHRKQPRKCRFSTRRCLYPGSTALYYPSFENCSTTLAPGVVAAQSWLNGLLASTWHQFAASYLNAGINLIEAWQHVVAYTDKVLVSSTGVGAAAGYFA